MSIKVDDLKKISKLAKLKFSEEELERYTNDLNSIMAFCEKIDAVDTSVVGGDIHPEDKMPERADVCYECDKAVLDNAPDKICDMFAVPKVI